MVHRSGKWLIRGLDLDCRYRRNLRPLDSKDSPAAERETEKQFPFSKTRRQALKFLFIRQSLRFQ